MHRNLRPPEPRQPFAALITMHAKFDVADPTNCRYTVFAATLLYYVTLTPDPVT